MRNLFTLIAVCLGLLSVSAQNGYIVKTLTFEDNDYVADTVNYLGQKNWSSLIDSPQYGGELLYGENHGDPEQEYSDVNYRWYDKGNTGLYSELPLNWDTHMYWGGGHAISNYWDGNLQNGDYTHQLSVYVPNNTSNGRGGHGHNGSDNFCVHYGYHDNSGYSAENLPWFNFKDGGEYTIEGMWVNNTTYFVNCVANGNTLTPALGEDETVEIEATGYKSDGTKTITQRIEIANSDSIMTNWTHFNLLDLGHVNKVEFNVVGDTENGYGFSLPAYFCYDDVAVRVPIHSNNNAKKAAPVSESNEDTKLLVITYDFDKKTLAFSDIRSIGTKAEDYEIILSNNEPRPFELAAGDEYTLTVKGIPQNAEITQILGSLSYGKKTKSTITAAFGENEFIHFSYGSKKLYDDEFPYYKWNQNPMQVELPFIENADTKCTGDLVFHQKCVEGTDAGCVTFQIYYKTNTSTGISDIPAEKTSSDAVYTLQGVRVSNPVKGQIYIKNGKKFIMK